LKKLVNEEEEGMKRRGNERSRGNMNKKGVTARTVIAPTSTGKGMRWRRRVRVWRTSSDKDSS